MKNLLQKILHGYTVYGSRGQFQMLNASLLSPNVFQRMRFKNLVTLVVMLLFTHQMVNAQDACIDLDGDGVCEDVCEVGIPNGDFSNGFDGFNTDYEYVETDRIDYIDGRHAANKYTIGSSDVNYIAYAYCGTPNSPTTGEDFAIYNVSIKPYLLAGTTVTGLNPNTTYVFRYEGFTLRWMMWRVEIDGNAFPMENVNTVCDPQWITYEHVFTTGPTQTEARIEVINLMSGEGYFALDNLTLFSPDCAMSVGSTAFIDLNDDGVQSGAGETGISGLEVNLYKSNSGSNDELIASDVTDAEGNYLFEDIRDEGDYYVEILPGTEYPISSSGALQADGVDSNDNGTQAGLGERVVSNIFNLTFDSQPTNESGQGGSQDENIAGGDDNGDMTIDFGFIPTLSLGSTVFYDNNNNGRHEPSLGEMGIEDVSVRLERVTGTGNQMIDFTRTDADGNYFFDNLEEGDYRVVVMAPDDAPLSSTDINTTGFDGFDGDDNGVQATSGGMATSYVVSLDYNEEPVGDTEKYPGGDQDDEFDSYGNMTVDFGFVPALTLGSTVFADINDNGIFDESSESSIDGVKVDLYSHNNGTFTFLGTTNTVDGDYLFEGLNPGEYQVRVTPDQGFPLSSTVTDTNDNNEDNDDNGSQDAIGNITVSPIITLEAGQEPVGEAGQGGDQDDAADANGDMTVDFGFVPALSIGSTVFADANDNGVFDEATESSIDGIRVDLYSHANGSFAFIGTTTTDGGDYLFEGLAPGEYQVRVTPNDDYPLSSTTTDTNDNNEDNDDNGAQASSGDETRSPVITLAPNQEPVGEAGQGGDQDDTADAYGDMTVDFGFIPLMSLGSTVFVDSNNDGMFNEATEASLDGVRVELYSHENGTFTLEGMTTTRDGDYFFDELLPGEYQVRVTPNSEYPLSSTVTNDQDNGVDNDDNGVQASSGDVTRSPVITLTPAQEPTNEAGQGGDQDDRADAYGDMTVDFGFIPLMSLGSTVFADTNNDGVFNESSESSIDGVKVDLYSHNNGTFTFLETTTTIDGNYFFDELVPGDYQVIVTPDNDYPLSSTTTVDEDNGVDNDDNGVQSSAGEVARSPVITLTPAQESTNEAGQGGGQDDAEDAYGDMSVDFGFVPLMSLGSTVFVDVNNDGSFNEATESSIDGVTVELYSHENGSFTLEGTTTTQAGNYFFNNLLPGEYQVRVTPDSDYPQSSTPTNQNDDGADNDDNGTQSASGETTVSPIITLAPGSEPTNEAGQGGNQDGVNDANGDMTIDFGFIPSGSIGSVVFYDANKNGVLDAGEEGIANVIVTLYEDQNNDNIAETEVAQVTTDEDGIYFFGNLAEGTYQVVVDPSTSYPEATITNTTENVDNNSNGTQEEAGDPSRSNLIDIVYGNESTNETDPGSTLDDANDSNGDMTIDFGFNAIGSLGSTVFVDTDNDGIQDSNEAGIPGVMVLLYAGNNADVNTTQDPIASGMTDENGFYYFDGLDQGEYFIIIETPDMFPLSSENTDVNDNDQDGDDNGIQVAKGDNVVSPVITLGLDEPTDENADAGGQADDASPLYDRAGNMTIDFGFVPSLSLGSTVWSDVNNNGIQDAGEQGVNGVELTLFSVNDPSVNATVVTGTDSNGDQGVYLFTGLDAGEYFLRSNVPDGYVDTSSDVFEADNPSGVNIDSDNNAEATETGEITSTIITLDYGIGPVGETGTGGDQDDSDDSNGDMTLDIGLVPGVSVGSTIFVDTNEDGMKSADEPGISGLELMLYSRDNSGNYILVDDAQATTDANGNYEFEGLLPGTYQVRFTPPNAYPRLTEINDPVDNGEDNDSNGTQTDDFEEVVSIDFVLTPGNEPVDGTNGEFGSGSDQDDGRDASGDMTIDFGLVPIMSIGSQTFIDNDDDGRYNPSVDLVLPDVNIKVYRDSGDGAFNSAEDATAANLAGEVTSDANGEYIVDGLTPGQYFVVASPNDGAWFSSRPTVTTDNLTDDGRDHGVKDGEVYVSPLITLTANEEGTDAQEQMPGGDLDNADIHTELNGDMTVDFGFVPQLSLGSTVFWDVNENSMHDSGEPGINGVELTIKNDGDVDFETVVVETRTIDGDAGSYFLEGLRPGEYEITALYPSGFTGTSSVSVLVNSSTSDFDNNARENDFADGFIVEEFVLSGVQPTNEANVGGNFDANTADNSYRDQFGNMTVDIGLLQLSETGVLGVGNLVFYDINDNGSFDDGESGLADVKVNLYRVINDERQSVIFRTEDTDDDGFYMFSNLPAGSYQIEVVPLADYPHSSGEVLEANYETENLNAYYGGIRPPVSIAADSDTDDVDDGNQEGSYGNVLSSVFVLSNNGEPDGSNGETGSGSGSDDGADDRNTNLTIDFGFTRRDKDNDAIYDHVEDANRDGVTNPGETDHCDPDTDRDRIWDGIETGVTEITDQTDVTVLCGLSGTNCRLDADGSTTTNPLDMNTDGDAADDDAEDTNLNGRIDAGETDPNDPSDRVSFVNTAVYLEGALAGEASRVVGNTVQYEVDYDETMRTKLNEYGLLPGQTPSSIFGTPTEAGQPYGGAPWNLEDESGMVDYDADVVDWVLVAIRTTMNGENMCAKAAMLHSDGSLTYVGGFDCNLVEGDEYHIAIMHRNHLPIISPLTAVEDGTLSYDFRIQDSYKYGFNYAQKRLDDGRYVMMSGNAEQVGKEMSDINFNDVGMWKKEFGLYDTYNCSDSNMDGSTSPNDKMIMLLNLGYTSSISN